MVTEHFKIDSDERGFTITKSLAWTLVAGLVGAAFWFGSEMTEVSTSLREMRISQSDFEQQINQEKLDLDSRLRVVERSDAQLNQAVRSQTSLLERIDRRLEALDQRIREEERSRNETK